MATGGSKDGLLYRLWAHRSPSLLVTVYNVNKPLIVIFALVSVALGVSSKGFVIWLIVLVYLLVVLLIVTLQQSLLRYIQDVLYVEVNLKRYRDILMKLMNHSRKASVYSRFNGLNFGALSYFSGDFKESVRSLEIVNLQLLKKAKYERLLLSWYFLILRSALFTDRVLFARLESEFASLKVSVRNRESYNQILDRIKAFSLILSGQVADNFGGFSADDKLTQIENSFFSGLNAELEGNEKGAEIFFKQISHESPDLFYVQEAKKYLATLVEAGSV